MGINYRKLMMTGYKYACYQSLISSLRSMNNRNALDLQARGATACHRVKDSSSEHSRFQRRESRRAATICFTSTEFAKFMKQNGIQHAMSAHFHPSSNGLAERATQSLKEGMRKMQGDSIETNLSRFLFSYKITPQAGTGFSPAETFMSKG